jgi:glycosyltransferase involved in cell wall biosynthesis
MSNKKLQLNIGFISTRFSGTDGVSLETDKWEQILEDFGHKCFWFAGVLDRDPVRSYEVEEAFFNHKDNSKLNDVVFGTQKRSRAVTDLIIRQKEFLKDEIYNFMDKFNIDLLIPENCLAIPMHIPLGLALTEVILETEVPVIAHHHDFYWERTRFLINAVGDIISSSFPPDLPSIKHVVINSMIQKDLAAKRGISSTVIYNVIDFDKEISPIDDFNRDFRKDLGFAEDDILILQPTRVVSRKGIEQALYLIQRLNLPKAKLLISHSAGDEGSEYFDWISESAKQQNIPVYFIYNHLHDKRKYDENGKKLYCLWDVYPHIDMVTYPSLYEGFGNAFLEAVYFKKPILVNRYSVYIVDIEPKGFDVIAIDGYLTQKAIEEVHDVLLNESRRTAMVEKNFNLGKKYFSISLLRKRLSSILSSIYGDDV